jgi:transposase
MPLLWTFRRPISLWAKERFIKHHGVSKKYFPLYLKELEFLYNNRNHDIFDLIANCLCDLVPKRD